MKPVKLGIIGCGVIGHVHLQAAGESPLINVVAVADLREEAAREAAEKFGVKKTYTNADALLADKDIEAVVLAMPTCGRTELAIKAFDQGKHVLTEKPVAMNAGEVERMIEARGKLTAACCSSRYRFTESARAASEFVASGGLGDLRVVRCRALSPAGAPPENPPPKWRLIKSLNGGGILVNWGCYDLDYVLGITGWSLKPKWVLARTWPVSPIFQARAAPGSDAETHLAALICCEGGEVITFERGEFVPAQGEGAWEVIGSKGMLHMAMSAKPEKIEFDAADANKGFVTKTVWQADESSLEAEGRSAIRTCLAEDFATAIREHRPPKTGLEQALIVQKITDAIYASAESGDAVTIN